MVKCVNALYLGLLISTLLERTFLHHVEVCQCPLSRATHFYRKPLENEYYFVIPCVNALYLGLLISTLPLQKPFIYAGFRPRFCMYLSEYSDNLAKQGQKVGRGRIVFF